MKCGYPNCKCGGEVDKIDGIKIGNRWYSKECANKRDVKSQCNEKLISLGMIPKLVNIFLKKVVDDESVELDYLVYTIDNIILNNLKLTSPYGVKYYMGSYKIREEYEKFIAKKISADINKGMIWDEEPPVNFKPVQIQPPSYLKILK